MSARSRRVIAFGVLDTLAGLAEPLHSGLKELAGVTSETQRLRLLDLRDEEEWELIERLEDWRPYREILAESLVIASRRAGLPLPGQTAARIAEGLGSLQPHGEVAAALAALARTAELALVSALDPEDLQAFAGRLGTKIAHAVSARTVSAFPPEPDLLLALLHEMELDEDDLLFVSARPDRELYTAQDLGIEAALVDRNGRGVPDELEVRWHVDSLDALARRLSGRRRRRRAPRG